MLDTCNRWLRGAVVPALFVMPLSAQAQSAEECMELGGSIGMDAAQVALTCAEQLPGLVAPPQLMQEDGDGFVALPRFPSAVTQDNGTVALLPDRNGYVEVETQAFYRGEDGVYTQRPNVTLMNAALFGASLTTDGLITNQEPGGSVRSKESTDYFVWDDEREIYRTCWILPEIGVHQYVMQVTDDPASSDNPFHIADNTQDNRTSSYSILQPTLWADDPAEADRMDGFLSILTVAPRNPMRTAECPINGPVFTDIKSDVIQGSVPLKVKFTATLENRQNTQSDNRAVVGYVFTPNDGTETRTVNESALPPSINGYPVTWTHTFESVGAFTGRLETVDPDPTDAIIFETDSIVMPLINVTNADPIVSLLAPLEPIQPLSAALFTPSVMDPDDHELACAYSLDNGDFQSLDSCEEFTLVFDNSGFEPLQRTITLRVTDGFGGEAEDEATFTVAPAEISCGDGNSIVSLTASPATASDQNTLFKGEQVLLTAVIDDSVASQRSLVYRFDFGQQPETQYSLPYEDIDVAGENVTTATPAQTANDNNIVAGAVYEAGQFTAKVVVLDSSDRDFCALGQTTFNVAQPVTITQNPIDPVAILVPDVRSGASPLTVAFDASDSMAGEDEDGNKATITEYHFEIFKAGSTELFDEAFVNDGKLVFNFLDTGTYEVKVTVKDSLGNDASTSVEILVNSSAVTTAVLRITDNDSTEDDEDASTDAAGIAGETVFTFDASESFPGTGRYLSSYEFDFEGDGTVDVTYAADEQGVITDSEFSTLPKAEATFVYSELGEYFPSVTVRSQVITAGSTTKNGANEIVSTTRAYVRVLPASTPAPTPEPTPVTVVTPIFDQATEATRSGSGAMGLGLLVMGIAGLGLRRRRLH